MVLRGAFRAEESAVLHKNALYYEAARESIRMGCNWLTFDEIRSILSEGNRGSWQNNPRQGD